MLVFNTVRVLITLHYLKSQKIYFYVKAVMNTNVQFIINVCIRTFALIYDL